MVPVLTFKFPIVGVLIIFDTIFCLFSNSLIFLQEVVKCRWWDNCIQCCICDISSIWYAVITVPLDLNFMLCYIIGPVSFAVSSWVGGGRFLHIIATDCFFDQCLCSFCLWDPERDVATFLYRLRIYSVWQCWLILLKVCFLIHVCYQLKWMNRGFSVYIISKLVKTFSHLYLPCKSFL